MFIISSAKISVAIIPEMTNAASFKTVQIAKHTLNAALLQTTLNLVALYKMGSAAPQTGSDDTMIKLTILVCK